jgi:proline iminopeptidase
MAGPARSIGHAPLFRPEYRIVLLDQRGCTAVDRKCVEDNTTWTLEDLERLRERCGIDRWSVFGGSLGIDPGAGLRDYPSERVSA